MKLNSFDIKRTHSSNYEESTSFYNINLDNTELNDDRAK